MDKIKNLERLIAESSVITAVVHTHPDGDALGSGLALSAFLRECCGKDAVLALPDSIPASLLFLTEENPSVPVLYHQESPEAAEGRILSSDLVICLDLNAFDRAGALKEALLASTAPKVLIDHHLNPDLDAFDLVFSTIESSSASEVLFHLLMQTALVGGKADRLPKQCLNSLMTGLTTDTNNFANSVFPSTLEMASLLIGAGAERNRILNSLYNCYRENRIRLMGYLLGENLQITEDGVAYMILDKRIQERFGFQQGEAEGFVNMPLAIKEVRMSILLTEDEGRFRVSVRSKEGTSANSFAREYFNGGGHELAAGGKLLIPEDIPEAGAAQAYILNTTSKFFSR
ncbi:MAG: bifunctional oligoribonuclease/PAP phosphatase NrnA [Candidatus Cryptobacteroides sp.]